MFDFDRSLPMLLLRAREAIMSHFRPVLSEYGLTEHQWRVLRVLWEENGMESNELADRTLMLRPSLSGVVDRLERDGLVGRKKTRQDGRKVCVWMTRKAKRLYERVVPDLEKQYSMMQSHLPDDAWDKLYTSLNHLINLNGLENKR